MKCLLRTTVLALATGLVASAGESLLTNGGFERGLTGWSKPWSRTPSVRAAPDETVRHGGGVSARIEHTGSRDWSFGPEGRLNVRPGEIYELAAWVRARGTGRATLCVVLRNARGRVMSWAYGARTTRATTGWRRLRSRFVVPPGAARMWPRLIGDGPATVWIDDAVLTLEGTMSDLRARNLPESLRASNYALEVTFVPAVDSFAVRDKRTGATWQQRGNASSCVVADAKIDAPGFALKLVHGAGLLELAAKVYLDGQKPELVVELSSDG